MIRTVSLLALSAAMGAVTSVLVGDFSNGNLDGWSSKAFKGRTSYELVADHGRRVLKAASRASASGLYKAVHVDLRATPYLHWSWKIDHTLGDIDEHSKKGDDYAARVYVVFSGGILFWRSRAINYVWSNNQPPGSTWKNAFTANTRMVAVRGGDAGAGRWFSERRNVREDYRRLFGEDRQYADAVAIMTDTDNSGKAATAYYGDIYFAAH